MGNHKIRLFLLTSLNLLFFQAAWAFDPQGQVSLTNASFLSEDYVQTNRRDFQFVGAGLDTLVKARTDGEIEDELQGQIRGVFAPGISVLSYLNVSQLFWKHQFLTVGRKKVNWSLLDENYRLGLYQPLFDWNPLQPESQGLTGVFITFQNNEGSIPWGLTLFGTPLYIPNQGAGYEIQDGEFKKSNPYFPTPPRTAMINGQEDQIDYTIQKPETQDIVFQRGFVAQQHVGDPKKGFYFQAAFANKPANDLILGFDGYHQILENEVKIDITPAVWYHSVTSADIQYQFSRFGFGISALEEKPEKPEFEKEEGSNLTSPSYAKSSLVSPFMNFKWKGLQMTMAYLSVRGGEVQFEGTFADKGEQLFGVSRYPYQSAYLIGASLKARLAKKQALALSSRVLQGSKSEFMLWTTTMNYQFQERWSLQVTGQMVDVAANKAGVSTDYYDQVNNDALAMGVSYVF